MSPSLVDGEFDLTDWQQGMAIIRGPEGRAEGQSPAERPLTVSEQPGAESETSSVGLGQQRSNK